MTAAPWKVATAIMLLVVAALLVALASIVSARNEARRARDVATSQLVTMAGNLATARANVASLETAIDQQGRAITDAAAQAAREQQAGRAALALVEQRNAALLESVGVLRRLLADQPPASCEEGWDAFRSNIGR